MPAPRKLRTKSDFLILGGGMAGLSALHEARRLGIDAICLEAHAKPGGRIRTVRNRRLATYPIELGAEFVHGSVMRELCQSLGLTLIKHPADGVAYVDGEFHPLLPIVQVFKRVRERAAAHLAAGKEDISVEEFIALMEADGELPPGVSGYLLLQLIRNDYAARTSELGLAGFAAPDFDGYEDNYRVAEGYDEVPRRLAEGCCVYCNHAASAVVRHRDRVDVVTNRGVYSANAVVVCLPVGVLKDGDVHFDPPLSHAKRLAIESVNAGAATKLVLCFRRNRMGAIFWPEGVAVLATALATQLWWPTGWGRSEGRHFLASCLVGGAAVQRFAERDPRQVGLAQLSHMFGRQRVEGKATASHYVKSWHDDPRIKGGYSSLPVGIDHESLLKELESPEDSADPQLFFAGDYVTRHPGSAHAAHQSGLAAIQRAAAMRTNG